MATHRNELLDLTKAVGGWWNMDVHGRIMEIGAFGRVYGDGRLDSLLSFAEKARHELAKEGR